MKPAAATDTAATRAAILTAASRIALKNVVRPLMSIKKLQFPRTAHLGQSMSRSLSSSPSSATQQHAAGSSGSRQSHLPAQKGLWIDQAAARIGRWLRIAVNVSRDLEMHMRKALAAGGAEDVNRCGGVYALSDRDQHRIVVEVAVVELIPRVPDDDPVAPEWVAGKGGHHTGVEGQEGLATTVVGRTDDDQVNAAVEWDRRVECGRAVGLLEAERNPPRVAADLAWHRPTDTCAHAQGEAQHARDVGVVWIVRDAWRVVVIEDRTLERVQRRQADGVGGHHRAQVARHGRQRVMKVAGVEPLGRR